MCALSTVSQPKSPVPLGLLFLLALIVVLSSGCTVTRYSEVPECSYAKPPAGEGYMKATPDERLVIMTDAYIHQVKSVVRCNNNIRLINDRNKAKPAR